MGLIVCILSVSASLQAASNPSQIICNGESVLQSSTYYGYVKEVERNTNRLVVTFEKYEEVGQADTSLTRCSFHTAECDGCKVVKRPFNSIVYRPANATSTVLCSAGSKVDEYRSAESFVKGVQTFTTYPNTKVDGLPVRHWKSLSDPSCASWVE